MYERSLLVLGGFLLGLLFGSLSVLKLYTPPETPYKSAFEEERRIRISHERGILSCINNGAFIFMPGYKDIGRYVICTPKPLRYKD